MKLLDRNRATRPACLDSFQHGRDTWGHPDMGACRPVIRASLEQMQGKLCAYCEGSLDSLGQHIEHFWDRDRYPQRTFDWHNMYWSCDRGDSCGRFKDNHASSFHPADLVDPCTDDPDAYFVFGSDGFVEVRDDISAREKYRAAETLRVFNLNLDYNHGGRSLCAERRRVLAQYLSQEPDLLQALEDLEPWEREELIQAEIASTATQPFGTIIRHFFTQAP